METIESNSPSSGKNASAPRKSKKRKRSLANAAASFPPISQVKSSIHPDFTVLAKSYPDFKQQWDKLKKRQKSERKGSGDSEKISSTSKSKKMSFSSHVNFKFNCALTRAILDQYFHLSLPSMPEGHLCPPVPNRFNYVLWVKQLIEESSNKSGDYFAEQEPEQDQSRKLSHRGLVLGTGSSCIYPLLLSRYQFTSKNSSWHFIGTEIDPDSVQRAQENINANELQNKINVLMVVPTIRGAARTVDFTLEKLRSSINSEILEEEMADMGRTTPLYTAAKAANTYYSEELCKFDFCMANPPFYSSEEEATHPRKGDDRHRTDMSPNESVYPGGEVGFALDMLYDSVTLRNQVTWYSLMLSRKASLVKVVQELKRIGFDQSSIRTVEFHQGNATRWGIAWTFLFPSIHSPAARLQGGLEGFDVILNGFEETPLQEVSNRIESFCVGLKFAKVKYNTIENVHYCIYGEDSKDTTSEKFAIQAQRKLFSIEIKLHCDAPCDKSSVVRVSMKNVSDFNDGMEIIRRIHRLLPGEIGRTNRRWRRLKKTTDSSRIADS